MTIIGLRRRRFTPQDGGQEISGMILHMTEERDNVEGYAVEQVFVSDRRLAGYVPQLGDEVRLNYNRFGRVDSVDLIQVPAGT